MRLYYKPVRTPCPIEITLLLTLANLVATWQDQGARRYWWLGAVAITVAERSATFSYFIPTLIRLMSTEDLPESEVKATLLQWRRLNSPGSQP